MSRLFNVDRVSESLLSGIDRREVGLWVRDAEAFSAQASRIRFLGLPWKLIVSEIYDPVIFKELEDESAYDSPMIRRRGFAQIIDSDPSRIELPQRCLPVFLLNGKVREPAPADFNSRLRKLNMLDAVRRSGIRELFVVATGEPILPDLPDIWAMGFRCHLTFASDKDDAEAQLTQWLSSLNTNATLLRISPGQAVDNILSRYVETYPDQRQVVRIRDVQGGSRRVDVTDADSAERPLMEYYSLVEERDLAPITAEELPEDEFVGFFRNSSTSWLPYAAGLPWIRDRSAKVSIFKLLSKLDTVGSEENCIAYISSESGAGGTTLAHILAWECACQGYPVLIAKQLPFAPDALPLVNYMGGVREISLRDGGEEQPTHRADTAIERRRYEAPWIIVFDTIHWQQRDSELHRFLKELIRSGRPVCILVVTDSLLDPIFHENSPVVHQLADLNHAISVDDAMDLGDHLNEFLRNYGKQRDRRQWQHFYDNHTTHYLEGTAAFWVALSFWIQGQYDLSESIQEWMYRCFSQNVTDAQQKVAILRIAAMSTENLPLPEALLPQSNSDWPISYLLDDSVSKLSALGLTRLSLNGERHWVLIHDILGRFLINALYYDTAERKRLGFDDVTDFDQLRFTLLRSISAEPLLGERLYRSLGEDFAISVFKVDPDHGRASFAQIWRDVISALAAMPRSLRDTSRLFRHHTAISRRRIAKLDDRAYGITVQEKRKLLEDAVGDLDYALRYIDFTPGAETNLNLLNSLAHAYFDLADIQRKQGEAAIHIQETLEKANDATRRAYEESPTNSFVIETYVKNLLNSARQSPDQAVGKCIEILGIVWQSLTSRESAYRTSQLGNLADQALSILLQQTAATVRVADPTSPTDVLVQAWQVLARDANGPITSLADLPTSTLEEALNVLRHDAGRGSTQVLSLSYSLLCISETFAFARQLEIVEQLYATRQKISPQLRLEYAILLYQNGRAKDGDTEFRALRQLWRESDHFVEVPERLRWLRVLEGQALKVVQANVESEYGARAMARVAEFRGASVPFRPEEFSIRYLRAGARFECRVSFGHNGPFLRPTTAGPHG